MRLWVATGLVVGMGSAGLAACAASDSAGPSPLESARQLRDRGEWAASYDAYAAAVCRAPEDPTLVRELLAVWRELSAVGSPLVRLECALPPPTAAYAEGLIAATRGDLDAADAALARAEATLPGPGRADAALRRGLVQLEHGTPSVAVPHLERALNLAPSDVRTRLALAEALIHSSRAADARQVLGGILKVTPTAAELSTARQLLASGARSIEPPLAAEVAAIVDATLTALGQDELSTAVSERIAALARETRHPRVLLAAGVVALRRGLEGEGATLLAEQAAANPLSADGLRALGLARLAAGRPQDAFEPLVQAFARDPFDPQLSRLLGEVAVQRGAYEVGREAYRTSTILESGSAGNFLWLARMERQLGNLEAARQAIERGRGLDPRDVPLLLENVAIEALLMRASHGAERAAAHKRGSEALAVLGNVSPEHPGLEPLRQSLETP